MMEKCLKEKQIKFDTNVQAEWQKSSQDQRGAVVYIKDALEVEVA